MAEVSFEVEDAIIRNRCRYISWTGLANGDTGQPLEFAGHADKTVHFYGTWGAGGTVSLYGSNDPTAGDSPGTANWVIMNDPQDLPLTATSDQIDMVIENPRFIRPVVTAGDGTTDITVVICAKAPLR